MADSKEVSLFHIYRTNAKKGSTTSGDYAIQTIWELASPGIRRSPLDRQCQIYFMDYKTFWKGTLTRQDWERQYDPKYEGRLSKEQYADLTKEAFKGIRLTSDKQWELSLSVRPSETMEDVLELTWAGIGTNRIGEQSIQGKTKLGTIELTKVQPKESEKILRGWIDTTIKDRGIFERISSELKGYTRTLEDQQKDGIQRLKTFEEQHIKDKNDLLEKFRTLINAKKEKIAELFQSKEDLQKQVETLRNAVTSHNRSVSLEAEVEVVGVDEVEDEYMEVTWMSTLRTRAGTHHSSDHARNGGREDDEDWKDGHVEKEAGHDDEEPLIRRTAVRQRTTSSNSAISTASTNGTSDMSSKAMDLMNRVTKAAEHSSHSHSSDLSNSISKVPGIKREASDGANDTHLLRKRQLTNNDMDTDSPHVEEKRTASPVSTSSTPTPKAQTRFGVFGVKKSTASKPTTPVRKASSASYSPNRSLPSLVPSIPTGRVARHKKPPGGSGTGPSITSEEDLYKQLE
ncbi:hypothetical protein BG003_008957 [Podila horticola]|nr:hypothetical protein BG003_008957 [Podila horticola]